MNIVKAFEQYNLFNHFPPISGAEQTALDAYTVWLIQSGLLSVAEVEAQRLPMTAGTMSSCSNPAGAA